jgi:hypothetical protein
MMIDVTIDYSNGSEKRFRTETSHPRDIRVVDILRDLHATPPFIEIELSQEGTDRGGGLFGWIKSIDSYPGPAAGTNGHWAVWIGPSRILKLFSGFNSDLPPAILPHGGGALHVLVKFVNEDQPGLRERRSADTGETSNG